MACLSSRIPHGEPVTPEKLAMVEQAENVLRDLGFYDVRVRHHELPVADWRLPIGKVGSGWDEGVSNSAIGNPKSAMNSLARIEVGPSEMARLLSDDVAGRVAAALKRIGYAHVTLDLQGYRRGSLNEAQPAHPASAFRG
jgi:uncharacterized protein